jgi:hypothetical protein
MVCLYRTSFASNDHAPRSLSVAVPQIAITIIEVCVPSQFSSLVSHRGVSVSGICNFNILADFVWCIECRDAMD